MRSPPPTLLIRPERPDDADAVRAVLAAAFPGDVEARLVDLLRQRGRVLLALVAELDGRVVGHVLFSPVTVGAAAPGPEPVGLAPVAVLPEHQGRGIGSRLIEEGLAACRAAGHPFVVLLGEPAYYRRFGFRPAHESGLDGEFGGGDAFMVLELRPGSLRRGGLVRYAPEFTEVFSPPGGV